MEGDSLLTCADKTPMFVSHGKGVKISTCHNIRVSKCRTRSMLLLLITSVVSDSVQPHRRQPTRLAVPGTLQARTLEWVGLPFPSPMHENEKWKWSRSVLSDSSRPHGLQPTRLLCPWDFPGKSTGVGRCCLLWTRSMSFSNLKRPWRMWIEKKMIIKNKRICYFSENVWRSLKRPFEA